MRKIFTRLLTFIVLLSAYQSSRAQLIVHESFDNLSSFPPTGWTDSILTFGSWGYCSASVTPDCDWYAEPSYSGSDPSNATHSGAGMAFYNSYDIGPGAKAILRSPAINNTISGGMVLISYWVYNSNNSWASDVLDIKVDTSATGTGFVTLRSITPSYASSWDWVHYTDTLPSTLYSSHAHVIFYATSQYGIDMTLDDVDIARYTDCGGVPNAAGLDGPDHVCSGSSFTLTDTSTAYILSMNYVWQQRSSASGTWSTISGATSASYNTSISSSTDYRVIVTCANSGYTDTSLVKTVNVNPFYICYCKAPDYTLGGDTLNKIDSVAIASTSLKLGTHYAFPDHYKEFYPTTPNSTGVLSQGGVYTLFAKYSTSCYGMAWIDYNHDGYLSSSEFIQINTSKSGSGSKIFTVPTSADTGLTGMRIRNSPSYYPYYWYNCSNFSSGEVADFVINIIPQPNKDLGATAVTSPAPGYTACANKVDSVYANIFNFGKNAISGFKVYATYSGPTSGTIITAYSGTINPLSTTNVYVGTINPPLGGHYDLKVYTVASGDSVNTNDTAYSSFDLHALPASIVLKTDTICPGAFATVGVVPSSSVNYRWYTSPTASSYFYTDTSMTLYSLTSDTLFYVSAVDKGTGCESIRQPLSAAVAPPPGVNLGPDATICESPTFVLDAGNPGAKYHWNTGDTTEQIHVRASGTYIVNVYHYCSASDTINLTVKPLPKATGIDYVRAGTTYAFEASGPQYVNSFLWLFGDGDTSTLTSPIHAYKTTEIYTVKLVMYNDCGSDTVTWSIPTGIYGIKGQSENVVNLYPNPAHNMLTLDAMTNNAQLNEITIINSVGAVVYRGNGEKQSKVTVNTSSFPAGDYILRANTSMGIINKLFQVTH